MNDDIRAVKIRDKFYCWNYLGYPAIAALPRGNNAVNISNNRVFPLILNMYPIF